METAHVNFWCHQCQEEIRPMYVPTPACPHCNGDFVEMIEEENDPRGFIIEGANQEEDEAEGQNNTLPALILSILQSVHRQADNNNNNNNENTVVDLTSSEVGNQDSTAPSSPGSYHQNSSQEDPSTRSGSRVNLPSFRNLLLEAFSSQFPSHSSQENSRGTETGSTPEAINDLDRIDGLHNTTQSRPYNPESQTEGLNSDSDNANSRPGLLRQMFTALSNSDWESGGNSPFTLTSRDGRYSLTANFASADDATNSRITPFLQLLTGMTGNPGDYALGPNALDNIITQLMEQTNSSSAAPPAPKETIDTLPVQKVAQIDVDSHEECPVCKDEYTLDEEVRLLPCSHRYHSDCIVPWLSKNGTCPVCRFSLAEPSTEDKTTAETEQEEVVPDESSVISLD